MTSNDPAAALAIPDGFNEALAAWQAHCECLLNDDHRKSPYWLPITECWSERKMQHAATLANYCVDALASVAAKGVREMHASAANALLYVWSRFAETNTQPEHISKRCNPHHIDWMFGRCVACHEDVRDIVARREKYDHRI